MFIIQIPYLDLNQTFKSGQHLRWKVVGENNFVLIVQKKIFIIYGMTILM